MKKTTEVLEFYEFGDFRLDCATRTLWRGTEVVSLPPRVFDTLCVLVERHGKIVSKQEIIDSVWADAFVEEGNLTQNIYTLRRVLGTDENGKNFIETLSKKGYRFAAEVEKIGSNDDDLEVLQTAISATENYTQETTKPTRFKYLIPIIASLFLVSLVVGLSLYYFRANRRESPSNSSQKMEFRQMTFSGETDYPVIAPAGDSFAYTNDGAIFIQENDSEKATKIEIPNETEFSFLQFSIDGKTINYRNKSSFFVPGDVFQVSRFGGKPQKIAENVWSGFSFSPNGNFLAFIRNYVETSKTALIIKNLASGEEHELAIFENPARFVRFSFPAWSSDGAKIAVSISRQTIHVLESHLAVFDVANGAIEEFNLPQLRQSEQAVWLPEGNALIVVARENKKFFQLWEVSYPEGKIRRITNDSNTYRNISLSSDGKKMLAGLFSTSSNIWSVEKENEDNPKQITVGNSNRNGVVGLDLTKNNEVIYSARVAGNIDLWKTNLQNNQKQQLTQNAGDVNSQPITSPDGKFIYFNSNRSGGVQIWRMDAETGANQTQITFGDKENSLFPQISPDGKSLFYIKKTGKKNTIWRKSLETGNEELVLVEGNFTPFIELSLSPDGNFLASCNNSENPEEENTEQPVQIAIVSTTQLGQPKFFNSSHCQVIWSKDSKSFYYPQNLERLAKVWRQNLTENENPELILNIKDAKINHFIWAEDEKTLIFSSGKQAMDVVQLVDFR